MSSNVIPISNIAPRAPIVFNQKSGTRDFTDGYKASASAWRAAAREEAIQTLRLNPERDYIRGYTDMLEGRYMQRNRPRYRSSFFDNRLAEARLIELCSLTDVRPSMEVSCSTPDIDQYVKQSDILRKTIQSIWDTEDLDLRTEAAVDHAMLSVGYWKIGATMATESSPARMLVTPCGMDMVMPIQPAFEFQDCSAVLYRVFKPLHRIKQGYGASADGIEREISGSFLTFAGGAYPDGQIPDYTSNSQNPAIRSMPAGRSGISMASEAGPFASVEVEEYWIDDPTVNESAGEIQVKDPRLSLAQHNYHYRVPRGDRLFPRKRLMVWAGNQILYDGPSPYWHGLFPFAQMVLRPGVWRLGGISCYRNLVPLQLAMNEVGAGVLDLTKRAVDPQMAFADGALDDTSFKNFFPDRPGGMLKMAPNAQWGSHARYVDPPPIPSYVGAFTDRVDRAFDRQSGALDTAGMMNKKQVPGGDTIQTFQDSAATIFRLDSRHIEPFMRAAGNQFVSNIFQYWSRSQRMWMLGKDGITWEDFDFSAGSMVPWSAVKEDHYKKFPVRIAAGSMHGGKTDRDKQLSVSLFRLGGVSRRWMLKKLGLGESEIDKIEQEIADEHGGDITPDATGKGAVPRMTRTARTGNPF